MLFAEIRSVQDARRKFGLINDILSGPDLHRIAVHTVLTGVMVLIVSSDAHELSSPGWPGIGLHVVKDNLNW